MVMHFLDQENGLYSKWKRSESITEIIVISGVCVFIGMHGDGKCTLYVKYIDYYDNYFSGSILW